ncbi:MAG: glycosyltransferase family 4 protein, partial [Planctomycetota bacterium]
LLLRRHFNKSDADVRPGVIVTFHEFRSMRNRWRARAAGLMVGADAVVTVDDEDLPHAQKWASYVAPVTAVFGSPVYRGIAIAPNAEPVETNPAKRRQWRQELGLADDEFAAVFFGILYPHKGIEEMLDAIEVLRASNRKIRPVVVGDFDRSDDWTRRMEQRLAGESIIWQRGVSLNRVSEVLHACDVGVLPFHTGCGPNRSSLLACVAHGLPTITTDGPCTPDTFRDESPLVYVPVQNAGAIGGALRRLMDDQPRREELRKASLEMAAKRAWPQIARQHLDLYASLGQEETVATEASA